MSIELLWILPVLVMSSFGLFVLLKFQKRHENSSVTQQIKDLNRQVKEHNSGVALQKKLPLDSAENRFGEMERTIHSVSQALSQQQKIIEQFKGKDVQFEIEFVELKQKLRVLQVEYDVLLSENATLKVKLRKLEQERELHFSGEKDAFPDQLASNKVVTMHLYNDLPSLPMIASE